MAHSLGPLDVYCDAPPYTIVRACESLDFQSPLDVRWCRLGHFLLNPPKKKGPLTEQFKKLFFGSESHAEICCSCGHHIPRLESYTFLLLSGKQVYYLLGQCSRCHTIFWEKP